LTIFEAVAFTFISLLGAVDKRGCSGSCLVLAFIPLCNADRFRVGINQIVITGRKENMVILKYFILE